MSSVKAQKFFSDTKIFYAKVVVNDTLDLGELGKMILNLDNVVHIKEEGSIVLMLVSIEWS